MNLEPSGRIQSRRADLALFDRNDANLLHIAQHDVTAEEAEHVLINDLFDLDTRCWRVKTGLLRSALHGRAVTRALAAREPLQLAPENAERTRRQAKNHGMEYQDYLKMVFHQALLLEEKRA